MSAHVGLDAVPRVGSTPRTRSTASPSSPRASRPRWHQAGIRMSWNDLLGDAGGPSPWSASASPRTETLSASSASPQRP
ncbi:hypothetical protein QJS66_02975 [Kocuria rhizophila]|nr:hypothetical protein QJS66_02975 [Kocuria rhizophila]